MSQAIDTLHDGHEAHHEKHQHHFTTMPQQFEASKIGMWLFLATEILLFGGLFVGYGIMQSRHPEAFIAGHTHLQRELGATNTVVLLVSSFTMVLAVWAASTNRQKLMKIGLALTILCAFMFFGVKYVEYSHKIHDGLLPGKFFSYQGADAIANPDMFIFFSFYFVMTGIHGLHVLIGIIVLSWVLLRAMKNDYSSSYYTPVDLAGLYWHLVDLIWIYLFPLLYLIS
jgi:cytochrome c oxidase subunit III